MNPVLCSLHTLHFVSSIIGFPSFSSSLFISSNFIFCTLVNFNFVGLENANEIPNLDSNKRYKVNYYPKREIDKRLTLVEIKEETKTEVIIDKKLEIDSLEEQKQDILAKIRAKAEIVNVPLFFKNYRYYMQPITSIQNFDEDDYKIWKLFC